MTKEKYPRPRVWLNIEICEVIYKAFKEYGPEARVGIPVPNFESRYPNVLESILGSVQYKADRLGYDVRKTAVYYFVYFAKSQCFLDANKRMSVLLTDVFIRLNGHILKTPSSTLRDLAILVAKNKSISVEEAVNEILRTFEIAKRVN